VEDDDPAVSLEMVLDSAGNIYLLSPLAYTVYVYNPQGQFQYQFGEKGDRPGQLSGFADVMAIDSHDRLYIASGYRIDQFDTRGEYLGRSFEAAYDLGNGPPMDMVIDAAGSIYMVTNGGKVIKYRLNIPD
jgi:sugar lactone lactonase YvrE